jgi:hypothetical protein
MARLGIIAQPALIVTGTALKTLLQLVAPTNQRVAVREISISFNGVSNTSTPILVEVVRQTSAGTITNVTTLRKTDPDISAETIQTTCKDTATVEPTDGGDVPIAEQVHPQTGFLWQPGGMGIDELIIPGGGRLGVRVTAGTSVSAAVRVRAEE